MADYKCPKCDSDMTTEGEVVECQSCDHTIELSEAIAMFESGDILMSEVESDEYEDEDEEDDSKDESTVTSLHLPLSETTEAGLAIATNYDAFKALVEGKSVEEAYKEYISEDTGEIDFTNLQEGITIVEEQTVDLDSLLEGAELDTEFKDKAKLVFEAAVAEKVSARILQLEALNEQFVELAISEKIEVLEAKADDYLTYVAEQFVEENKIAIESGLKVEAAEKILAGVKSLVEDSALTIDESQVDVVADLESKVLGLEESVSKGIDEAIVLKKEIASMKRSDIVSKLAEGLTDTQAEKLVTLTEDIDFSVDLTEEFKTKVLTIKESFFKKGDVVVEDKVISEAVVDIDTSRADFMKSVVSILGKK